MAEIGRIDLQGKWAVAAIVVIAGLFVFGLLYSRDTLESEALDKVKTQLAAEYASKAMDKLDTSNLESEDVDEVLNSLNVTLKSVSVRGLGNEVVVRVEPLVNGKLPPDGKRYRYYRIEHGLISGWRYPIETTALSYHLKFY